MTVLRFVGSRAERFGVEESETEVVNYFALRTVQKELTGRATRRCDDSMKQQVIVTGNLAATTKSSPWAKCADLENRSQFIPSDII